MDRGAWRAMVSGVAKTQTRLNDDTARGSVFPQGRIHLVGSWPSRHCLSVSQGPGKASSVALEEARI